MKKCIFHVDVNSAFLSWSAVKRLKDDPTGIDLRTIPSAVAGDVQTRHGIITAKSIPAKKYGIATAEPVVKALQKCPELVLVKSDFATYREYSRQFISILQSYTDLVQQVSIDEAFMDLTDSVYAIDPLRTAAEIKDRIHKELGFTVNVGISVNKLLAKMASAFEKPDKVHTLYPEEIKLKMWPLSVRDLFGCGKKTAEKLVNVGITTIGEAANTDPAILISLLGDNTGKYIHNSANGMDDSCVTCEAREAKSYSNESTTIIDIDESNYASEGLKIVHALSEKVSQRMQRDGVYAFTIEASIKTDDFKRRSHQRRLSDSTNDSLVIEETAKSLLNEMLFGKNGLFSAGQKIRLIGVGAGSLDKREYQQMSLFDMLSDGKLVISENIKKPYEKAEKNQKLQNMMSEIDQKFGKGFIKKGIE